MATSDVALRTGTSGAESACVAAVNRNMADSGTSIISSDSSEAGTVVMLRSSDATTWRCLASNDGVVEDLSVVE